MPTGLYLGFFVTPPVKMERNPDMYVSTLCVFIQAMGGHLEIIAQLPEGDFRINQFSG
ncbi:MAG TPA: hypothetical protein VFG19_08655 [Geobacteraceae bacterium]|nr:hypothetical protein [Geobacteraceae bacterium]